MRGDEVRGRWSRELWWVWCLMEVMRKGSEVGRNTRSDEEGWNGRMETVIVSKRAEQRSKEKSPSHPIMHLDSGIGALSSFTSSLSASPYPLLLLFLHSQLQRMTDIHGLGRQQHPVCCSQLHNICKKRIASNEAESPRGIDRFEM